MRTIKKMIKNYLPYPILQYLKCYHGVLHTIIEKKINPLPHRFQRKQKPHKEIYFVHQVSQGDIGILSLYCGILYRMTKKAQKGYKVLVDFERPSNASMKVIGVDNAWEYTFDQPCRESVLEIKQSDRVIIEGNILNGSHEVLFKLGNNRAYYYRWKKIADKTFPLRRELRIEYDFCFNELFRGKRVLGVCLREEFRELREAKIVRYEEHPNEPKIKECINIAAKKMIEFNCEYVYITTIYEDTVEAFGKAFSSKLLYIKRSRGRSESEKAKRRLFEVCGSEEITEKMLKDYCDEMGESRKKMQINYIKEIYGLSKCTALVGTPSGGMKTALIWNGGSYENVALLDQSKIKGSYYEQEIEYSSRLRKSNGHITHSSTPWRRRR